MGQSTVAPILQEDIFARTRLVLGNTCIENLSTKRVALFGVGGVGSFTAEALARSGVGTIDLIDNETVSASNINRQIIALHSTIGKAKVDVMKERILDISPLAKVNAHKIFFLQEQAQLFDWQSYHFIIDCIDTVSAKIQLVLAAQKYGVPIISCMGTGNKKNPLAFEIADIYKTKECPLARVMRHELKKRNVKALTVLYSKEKPCCKGAQIASTIDDVASGAPCEKTGAKRAKQVPGSTAFVPSVAGLIIASHVVNTLLAD